VRFLAFVESAVKDYFTAVQSARPSWRAIKTGNSVMRLLSQILAFVAATAISGLTLGATIV